MFPLRNSRDQSPSVVLSSPGRTGRAALTEPRNLDAANPDNLNGGKEPRRKPDPGEFSDVG